MRRLAAAALVGVLTVLALFGLAAPASAHNRLIDSDPAERSSVESGPDTVELTFDQPVQSGEGLNSIEVVGPNGDRWEDGAAQVNGAVVTAPVAPLGPKGDYTIEYRIMSADGHPVSGELRFTLTTEGEGTPTATAEDAEDGGIPVWLWIVGAAVLLGAGLVLALRPDRRNRR